MHCIAAAFNERTGIGSVNPKNVTISISHHLTPPGLEKFGGERRHDRLGRG
jgi:hypothetical protein